jgi:predicted  nucleic acid-binding Zn-ribbon protein
MRKGQKLKKKEERINELLKEINPDYEIALLRKTRKGRYQFALKAEFDPRDLEDVRAAFRSVLEELKERRPKIQTKIYLPEAVHSELRRLAYETHSSFSDVVAQGILAYAAKRT